MIAQELVDAGNTVDRYHTEGYQLHQLVSSHSWGVAMLIVKFHSEPSLDLIKAALMHDLPEKKTGDVHFSAKREHPQLKTELEVLENKFKQDYNIRYVINEQERRWLKWADYVEGLIHCIRLHRDFGYKSVIPIACKFSTALEEYIVGRGVVAENFTWYLRRYIEKEML